MAVAGGSGAWVGVAVGWGAGVAVAGGAASAVGVAVAGGSVGAAVAAGRGVLVEACVAVAGASVATVRLRGGRGRVGRLWLRGLLDLGRAALVAAGRQPYRKRRSDCQT